MKNYVIPLVALLLPGLCLDIQSSGATNGTLVQVYTCNNTNAQNWALQ